MLQALIPSAVLLITPFNASLFAEKSCLTNSFYGSFGGQSVFNVSTSCLELGLPTLDDGAIIPIFPSPAQVQQQLVWVQKQVVDDILLEHEPAMAVDALGHLFSRLSTPRSPSRDNSVPEDQQVFSAEFDKTYEILHRTPSSVLLSVSPDLASIIDINLPRFYKSTLLPTSAVPYIPVPPASIVYVKSLLSSLKFNPVIASIVNSISISDMKRDIRYLTGEDEESPILSRHSFAAGSRIAAEWLKDRFEEMGATCELKHFLAGFAPNVICHYSSTAENTGTVLLAAHYDSRGSFGSMRAPGADDDGSGVMALLGIARAIALKGPTFRSNVQMAAFAGEEQGLLGSRAYSRELRHAGANITVMIQADMLAYRAPGEPAQLGLPDLIGTPEVAQLVANVSAIYSPELIIGLTPSCCSDHQSFHEQGFPATHVFERAGPIADPMYHNSGDLSDRENYDFEQVRSIAKVELATLLHAAGFDLPE